MDKLMAEADLPGVIRRMREGIEDIARSVEREDVGGIVWTDLAPSLRRLLAAP